MSAGLAALALLAAHAADAHARACVPSRAMLVLDKSSSMVTGRIGGVTKWSLAANAIGEVLGAYEASVEFGLVTFPAPSQCSPGQLSVAPALGNQGAIATALQTPPPATGNYTPMAQTLEAVADLASWEASSGPKYAILISDGWQWCSPYDPATRFAGELGIAALTAQGIKTFVVGFGGAVDALALGRMAVLAGTQLPGCDVGATDPASPSVCYHQADNQAQLIAALQEIAGEVATEEHCDGLDNDCDGEVDEQLVRACDTACGRGSEVCHQGAWSVCDAPSPSAEACDGIDNNCDGAVDTGCACLDGASRPCGEARTVGVCQAGHQACEAGQWGACEGQVVAGDETCDNLDNDCDGLVDEQAPGPTTSLWSLPPAGMVCEPGQVCRDGTCGEPSNPTPPPFDEAGGAAASCACQGRGNGSDLLPLAFIGAFLALRRRRSA